MLWRPKSKNTLEDTTLVTMETLFSALDELFPCEREPHRWLVFAREREGNVSLHRSTTRTVHKYSWQAVDGRRRCYIERLASNGSVVWRAYLDICDVVGMLRDDSASRSFQAVYVDGIEAAASGDIQEEGSDRLVPLENWPSRFNK